MAMASLTIPVLLDTPAPVDLVEDVFCVWFPRRGYTDHDGGLEGTDVALAALKQRHP